MASSAARTAPARAGGQQGHRRAVPAVAAGARAAGSRLGTGGTSSAPLGSHAPDVLGREQVGELQRARILAAMTELVRERGAAHVTVAHVVARSGVSRRTFYEQFDDREGCLLAAFEHALECAARAVRPAYESASGWRERIRAGLAALLEFLDVQPAMGGFCIVDALAAEPGMLERRRHVLDVLVGAVHEGGRGPQRSAARNGRTTRDAAGTPNVGADGAPSRRRSAGRPPRIVAEGAVGAVLGVIHGRMLDPAPAPLSGLLGQLMSMIVLPYLGPAAAARELERPSPQPRELAPTAADPLREIDMRLTYRTVRVLIAIAELGEAGLQPSGRQVADASGISDQGQMSKLLARLQHLGLIHNSASGRSKGEPNAWVLTSKGQDVEHAIRIQTSS
jgi:AcrR family transcriptional regulator